VILEYLKSFLGNDSDCAFRRAAGEALALVSEIEGDQFTNQMVKSLIASVSKSRSASTFAACAFALGSIKRLVSHITDERFPRFQEHGWHEEYNSLATNRERAKFYVDDANVIERLWHCNHASHLDVAFPLPRY
jgi:hypothetical protein